MAAQALPPVLVIDDSDDDLHLMKRLLAKAGVKNPVVTFNDVNAVMAFLKAASSSPASGLMPCVVFTDLKMPGMDGFDLLTWIRGQRAFAQLPVVIVSSAEIEKDIKRAKALGANEYLVKLPTPKVMAEIVAHLFGRKARALK